MKKRRMHYQAVCEGAGGKCWLAASGMMPLIKEVSDDETSLCLLGLMGQHEYSCAFNFLPSDPFTDQHGNMRVPSLVEVYVYDCLRYIKNNEIPPFIEANSHDEDMTDYGMNISITYSGLGRKGMENVSRIVGEEERCFVCRLWSYPQT